MPPFPKFKAVRQAVALRLLGPKALNKVVMVMCSQLTEAFNTRVRLFSRWMYVVKAAEEFVDNYTKAYFWTVAIKQWAMKTKTN